MSNWLQNRLVEIGRTQADLARHLGISSPRVSEIAAGKRRVQTAELASMAAFLQVDPLTLATAIDPRAGAAPKRRDWAIEGLRRNKLDERDLAERTGLGIRRIRAWLDGADLVLTPAQDMIFAEAIGIDVTAFMSKTLPPAAPSPAPVGASDRQTPYAPPPIDPAIERDALRIAMSTAEIVAGKRPLTAEQRADLVSDLLPIIRDRLATAKRR